MTQIEDEQDTYWGKMHEDYEDLPDVPYYRFSKGVEVKDITAHLMSFPAQIVQYASRSGRVDGNCKSEETEIKIQDFKKIIDFAKWEIERLEGDS